MRTIRIGNDIRLKITLDGIGDYENTSIKQVKCYVKRVEDKSTENFHCGFSQYISDDYNLNTCGFPAYRVHPSNCNCKYDGFGVFPKSRTNKHRCFDFLMPSKILNEKNLVECYFPANELRYCGIYLLTVVIVMYQYGWGPNNLRTYTVDYGLIFELVDNNTGESGDLTITVTNSDSDDYHTITFSSGFGNSGKYLIRVLKNTMYTLPQCTFAPPVNYVFDRWLVNSYDITDGLYRPGDIISITSDTSVVAKWEDNLHIMDTLDRLDKDMDKLRLPEGEEFVIIKDK